MRYFCLEIEEQTGEREHNTIIRIKAANQAKAQEHMNYWLSYWFSEDVDSPCIPDESECYEYYGGEISVREGFIREISFQTFTDLEGILPDMTLTTRINKEV